MRKIVKSPVFRAYGAALVLCALGWRPLSAAESPPIADSCRILFASDWRNGISRPLVVQKASLDDVAIVDDPIIHNRKALRFRISRDEDFSSVANGYVLVMLVPTSYLLYQLSNSKGRIIGFVLVPMAYLSTSTGAFLLSLSVFFKAKNLAFKNIMIILLSIIFVIIAGLALLSIADPMTYDKIAAPFKLINSGGWDRLVGEARNGGGITYLAADQQGSFTWRAYAYLVYGFFIAGETWDRFIFGNGVGGYEIVWGGAMPHNDFILILTDFGFLFFIVWVSFCGWLLVKVWREYPQWFAVVVAFIFRLLCENNIYSYYVASIGCVIFSLIFGAITRASRERGAVRAQASRAVA